MVEVETKTKSEKIEYNKDLLTVVLVKRTQVSDRKMVGKTLLEWTSSAFQAFDLRVVESKNDAYTIATCTQTASKYIMVVDAQYPLIKKQDVIEMLDYMIFKNLEVGHFLFGTIYLVHTLANNKGVAPLFVVPIGSDRAVKVEDDNDVATYTKVLQDMIHRYHLTQGVRILHPDTTIIDCNVTIGKNVTIAPFVMLTNGTVIGDGCYIGSFTSINRSTLMPKVEVYASRLENVLVKENHVVGSYKEYHDCEV